MAAGVHTESERSGWPSGHREDEKRDRTDATCSSTLDGAETKIEDDELEELRAQVRGDVLTPADDGFDANPIYNAMHSRRPALKVRATGTADVVDIVNSARQRSLLVAIRGGGHSVAGLSSVDCGVVIDLTRMRAVTVDAYGANTGRRRAIKKQYDPDKFFRINPNILPA
jgi:FAD binding domain/Berberine and berberine like